MQPFATRRQRRLCRCQLRRATPFERFCEVAHVTRVSTRATLRLRLDSRRSGDLRCARARIGRRARGLQLDLQPFAALVRGIAFGAELAQLALERGIALFAAVEQGLELPGVEGGFAQRAI